MALSSMCWNSVQHKLQSYKTRIDQDPFEHTDSMCSGVDMGAKTHKPTSAKTQLAFRIMMNNSELENCMQQLQSSFKRPKHQSRASRFQVLGIFGAFNAQGT